MVGDKLVPLAQPICRESCVSFKSVCAPDLKTPEGLQVVNDYNFQLPLCESETYVKGQVTTSIFFPPSVPSISVMKHLPLKSKNCRKTKTKMKK
jgi:hypothetical protein